MPSRLPADPALARLRFEEELDAVADEAPSRPQLHLLSERELQLRSTRRRARITIGAALVTLTAAFLVVTAGNAVVTSTQLQVDVLNTALANALTTNQNLQLQRAELESPDRILSLAQHRLGMSTPKSVKYLWPVTLSPAPPASGSRSGPPARGHRASRPNEGSQGTP